MITCSLLEMEKDKAVAGLRSVLYNMKHGNILILFPSD